MKLNRRMLILAAGKGSRLGKPKALFPFQGKHWLQWQLHQIHNSPITDVTVALGYRAEELREKLAPILEMNWSFRIKTQITTHHELGPFSSILQFANSSLAETNGFWIQPIDVPLPNREDFSDLLAAQEGSPTFKVIRATHGNRVGHPVYISHQFAASLLMVDPSKSEGRLDYQISKLPKHMIFDVPLSDSRFLMNLNTVAAFDEFNTQI